MSTTRLRHSLPAPVVHTGFSVSQSKSHVLAGVQDAYWSDDEAEDAECPLCLEEMDISDLNFKPCVCGYQICRFCWHHIKQNLNKRCPACRRVYTDEAVEFKPIAPEDHKRLTQQKKQRDRERKELETLGRKHLANVRVVQRNVVYVVGIGPRFAKEELIPTLRSTEYFGQYGKISKILLVKRTSPGGGGPVVGLYITYHRKEDAGRCITAVDGVQSPGGGRDIMRASYGTTKYCLAFLRGVQCNDHSCMNLHEWGDEKDYFTKEDLATLKHTIKATENRSRTTASRKAGEDAGLPRAALWAQRNTNTSGTISSSLSTNAASTISASRQSRRPGTTRQPKTISPSFNESRLKTNLDRKAMAATSRPLSPTGDSVRSEGLHSTAMKQKEVPQPNSPTVSESEFIPMEPGPDMNKVDASYRVTSSSKPMDLNGIGGPPGLPNPPGLSAPPGLLPRLPVPPGLSVPPSMSTQSRPVRSETESPQTPLLASQTSYQMSTAARALVEDVKARRGSSVLLSSTSPFPDFDRTLQTLSVDDGSFSFNLDPKLADRIHGAEELSEFDLSSSIPFHGSFMDAFPALRVVSPQLHSPSLSQAHGPSHSIYDPSTSRHSSGHYLEKSTSRGSSYVGSFNPFSDSMNESAMPSAAHLSQYSPVDEERKVSRFDFARGRQTSTTSSPIQSASPLTSTVDHPFHHPADDIAAHIIQPWHRGHDTNLSLSHAPFPMHHPTQAQPIVMQGSSQVPLIDSDLSEAQLRNFILSSQERAIGSGNLKRAGGSLVSSQPFEDPAIMSVSYSMPANQESFAPMAYGPPPGLSAPQRPVPPPVMRSNQGTGTDSRNSGAQVPPLTSTIPPSLLSIEDFPALMPSSSEPPTELNVVNTPREPLIPVIKAREKAERKTVKKTSLVQKVVEKEKVAQSRVEVKVAEEAKVVRGQSPEKTSAIEETNPNPEPARDNSLVVEKFAAVGTRSSEPKGSTHSTVTERPTTSKKAFKGSSPSVKRNDPTPGKPSRPTTTVREASHSSEDAIPQVPLLSKKPKKSKPVVTVKPLKSLKEDNTHEEPNPPAVGNNLKTQVAAPDSSAANSRSQSHDQHGPPTSVHILLEQLDAMYPVLDLVNHPFFDPSRFTSPVKISLEYGPLVHALSALSVGGGSFANSIPSASIDNAVSSFQQLLETLTQTISDLLRLLPRTTWDDSSSFDGVLRDMLRGDDFLEDRTEDTTVKEDEVAALTLALERRARWMEVQLAKLEELHRDINTAAVRAILCFNDSGWDRYRFLPRNGNSLARYSAIGTVEEDGVRRVMTAEELEKKLFVAQEAAVFAETELRESMAKFQILKSS